VLTVLPPNIAASISVNYDTIPSTTPALSPAASAGVVPSVNWNNIASNGTGGFLHPTQTFHNHQGSVVAGFTVAASSGGPDSWNTAGTPDHTLFGDWINAGAGTTLTFAGIPYATYDLYLYESHYASNEVVTFTIGGEVQSLSNTAGPFGAPTHRLNDSYVKFTGLTASSISVVVAATSGSVGIAGFQIVDASPGGGGNAFADWIAGFPALGAATGFTDDPDGDGIENGIENYLGSNPSQPGIALTGVSSSAASITFRHTRSNNVAADVTAIYQWSSDLVNWFTSGQTSGEGTVATITPTVITDTDTPANDLIEVTVTVSGGSTARVFARIQGSQLP
jgi:hypothetical protein